MNMKRIFGAVLTILGIAGLIYGAVLFVYSGGGSTDTKALIIFGIVGIIFFIAGIGLIRTTKDESQTKNSNRSKFDNTFIRINIMREILEAISR